MTGGMALLFVSIIGVLKITGDSSGSLILVVFIGVLLYLFLLAMKCRLRITEEGLTLYRSTLGFLFTPSIRVPWNSMKKIEREVRVVTTPKDDQKIAVPSIQITYDGGRKPLSINMFAFREGKSLAILFHFLKQKATGAHVTEDMREMMDARIAKAGNK
jgi:hypothetical protein